MIKTDIKTRDGTCGSYVGRPTENGPWPAVLVFMDGLGIRPAMLESACDGSGYAKPSLFGTKQLREREADAARGCLEAISSPGAGNAQA